MYRGIFLTLLGALLVQTTPAPAAAQACPLCNIDPKDRKCFRGDGTLKPNKPGCEKFYDAEINLSIESDIDFGRLIMIGSGQGSVMINVDTGTKTVNGDLDDLGGIAMNGKAVVTGMPFRAINVDFPVRVTLRDPGGGSAEMRDFETNLPALAVLDADGRLEFNFTGTLYTEDMITVGGNLRGRIPIRVDYD